MIRFSASAHLQTAPITASSEYVPDSQSSGYRRNYYLLFEKNVLIAHIELHITEYIFGIYGTTGKNLTRFAWSKPLQICWTGVSFGH